MSGQITPQRRVPQQGRGSGGVTGELTSAVASFNGVFKSADKKYLEIQVESGDTMRMFLTRNTKFIRDGKAVKASDFHDGDKVTAEASRDLRMNLLAVKVELQTTAPPPANPK
jgi:hypothetical protein